MLLNNFNTKSTIIIIFLNAYSVFQLSIFELNLLTSFNVVILEKLFDIQHEPILNIWKINTENIKINRKCDYISKLVYWQVTNRCIVMANAIQLLTELIVRHHFTALCLKNKIFSPVTALFLDAVVTPQNYR